MARKFNAHKIAGSLRCRCGKELTGATNMDGDDAPRKEDISICTYCGAIGQFEFDVLTNGLKIRQYEGDEEIDFLLTLPQRQRHNLLRAQKLARDLNINVKR